MSTPSPKQPSKVTVEVSKNGRCIEYIVDVYEISTEIPERLKPYFERRRREARERAAQNPPPPSDDNLAE